MHPNNADMLKGSRLAFAQGGRKGTRLVYLTPPICKVENHANRLEAKWNTNAEEDRMPFKYGDAPILASNTGKSDFPQLESSLRGRGRSTLEGQFGSDYRSKTTFVDKFLAEELIRIYSGVRKKAPASAIASYYTDALPWLPPSPDKDRGSSYRKFLEEARGPQPVQVCGKRKRSRGCGSSKPQSNY